MNNSYEKHMQEVWDMKSSVRKDFIEGNYASYGEYIKHALKEIPVRNLRNVFTR